MPAPAASRTWIEIDPSALVHNARVARRLGGAELMAVVKANAYGHGLALAVEALRNEVAMFAVATVGEAEAVRAVSPGSDVLLLGPCLPAERAAAAAGGFVASVSSAAEAAAFPAGMRVCLKVDTGMGRIGAWHETALAELTELTQRGGVVLHSLATHLPSPDEDEAFTRAQLATFAAFVAEARVLAPDAKIHAQNSAGLSGYPEFRFDLVRAGLMLYGSAPIARYQPELRPALTWKARVTLLRDLPAGRSLSYGRTFVTPHPMRVATVAAGYADGYPRQASNQGAEVLLGGRRCAVLGRVTMDQILVDATRVADARVGDEVVLVGAQGAEEILAAELAGWAGTIAWDIFTGIGGRTERFVA